MNTTAALRLLSLAVLTAAGAAHAADPSPETKTLEEVVVTGTRERELKAETPATIHSVTGRTIRETRPSHPSEIMNQMPGVWVSVTGGEGHQTSIRQPLTTNPVYLYLEDGVPTRSTGFFNHNALYEINVPQADGIEVGKGPGTALYGSDAIGGVVNVLTRPAPAAPEADVSLEAGEFGWRRLLTSGGDGSSKGGFRADLNLTQTDGWRDATDYDRQSATLRLDRFPDNNKAVKTIVTYSHIDQRTAGSSALSRADYENNPTVNYTPISFREVSAFRVSSAWEREGGGSLFSVTPYVRYDDMDILPNWSLSYDPTVYNTNNGSIGVLVKYRRDFANRTRVITGLDVDHSPGSRLEKRITTTKVGSIYTSYAEGPTIYDYDVAYQALSPYVHGEMSLTERLRLTGGLRYDAMRYDYENHLDPLTTGNWRRPESTTVNFRHASPKLGVTYALSQQQNLFAGYSHGFRAPSESQLFRQGSAVNTVDLEAVKADNVDLGWRGASSRGSRFEVSFYHLRKKDDILSFRNPVTGLTESVNAGETLHRGIELGAGIPLSERTRLDAGWSYAKHTYEDWITRSGAVNVDYSGKEMETAPRTIGNTRLSYAPAALNGGKIALEWMRLGGYWEDAANTAKYEGHDVLSLRINHLLSREFEVFARLQNLTDERYAESASYTTARGEELSPGMPRTFYAGIRYNWKPATTPSAP